MGKGSPTKGQSKDVVNNQLDFANIEKSLLQKYSDTATSSLASSTGYWENIMKGGSSAQQATAPYAQQIQTNAGTTGRQIQNNLPIGGERNLALAELPVQTGTNIANLYQNLGPTAASQLGTLGLGAAGAGTGAGGAGIGAGSSLTSLIGQQQGAKGAGVGGIGQGLGTLAGGALGSKGTKAAASTIAAAL